MQTVYHQSYPLPCFSGTGLVHCPTTPTACQGPTGGVRAGEGGDDSDPSPAPSRLGDPSGRLGVDLPCGGLLMAGGGGGGNSSSGRGCDALMEAFGRRGRADLGVEQMRRRGDGGAVAAFDDLHARFKRQPAAGNGRPSESVAPPSFGTRELGLRTSMPKGNRWLIGQRRLEAGQRLESDGGLGGGEVYASIEAPVLSVGDARAAAGKAFAGIAGHAVAGSAVAGGDASSVGNGRGR